VNDLHNILKRRSTARALAYGTAVQQRQLRAKWLLCSTIFFCVREFIKTESATAVQRAFRLRFNIQPPMRKIICLCNHQFEQIGFLSLSFWITLYVTIIIQQDTTVHSLFISVKRSTCFGWYFHPSSGAHNTVFTVSGIIETITATIQSRPRQVTVMVSLMPNTVNTVLWAPDDGWKYHPKHVERLTDINKLCTVASCCIIIAIYYTSHGPLNIKCRHKPCDFSCFGSFNLSCASASARHFILITSF